MSGGWALVPTDDRQCAGGRSEVFMEVTFGTRSWTYGSKVGYPTAAPTFTSQPAEAMPRAPRHAKPGGPGHLLLHSHLPGVGVCSVHGELAPFHTWRAGAGLSVPRGRCHPFLPTLAGPGQRGPPVPGQHPPRSGPGAALPSGYRSLHLPSPGRGLGEVRLGLGPCRPEQDRSRGSWALK